MTKLRSLTVAAAVAFALAACASNDTMSDEEQTASRTSTSESTSGTTAGSESYPSSSSTSTAQTSPDTSTSSTAGTSADANAGTMPDPATGSVAGAGAAAGAPIAVGLAVETPTGESLGTVTQIVADATSGEPVFIVISAGADTTAMPYSAAQAMVQGDALVVDQARLAAAPHVEQGQTSSAGDWTSESTEYWGEGEVRTASPDMGTRTDDNTPEEGATETKPRG